MSLFSTTITKVTGGQVDLFAGVGTRLLNSAFIQGIEADGTGSKIRYISGGANDRSTPSLLYSSDSTVTIATYADELFIDDVIPLTGYSDSETIYLPTKSIITGIEYTSYTLLIISGFSTKKYLVTETVAEILDLAVSAWYVSSTGDGTGVSTLKMTVSEDIEVRLDGTARFYSDAGGTADESTTWALTTGAQRTIYLKCPSGTTNMVFSDPTKVLGIGKTTSDGWVSSTNAASLSGDISKFINIAVIRAGGSNTLSGDITSLTSLTYISIADNPSLSGSVSASALTFINLSGLNTISGDIGLIADGLTYCKIGGTNQMEEYTSGTTWLNATVSIIPYTGFGYSPTEIDNILIDMAASDTMSGRTITLTGTSAGRTSASDAAVTKLETVDSGYVHAANTIVTNKIQFGIIGDSISTSISPDWPINITSGYDKNNHAAGGESILNHMAAQVIDAENDNNNLIVLALGTNDDSGGDMGVIQSIVEDAIIALKASNPGAVIYYMNILPRWAALGGAEINKAPLRTAIAAACTAQSITCWDTYSTPWIVNGDTSDGTHPTLAGGVKVWDEIASRI